MDDDWEQSGHEAYVCPGTSSQCRNDVCKFCTGALTACTRCFGLTEGGTMTTQCPGQPTTAEQSNDIEDGKIDYRDGKWVNEPSPHSRKRLV